MFQMGAGGSVTTSDLSNAAAIHTWTSPLIDVSAETAIFCPIVDPVNDIGIYRVNIVVSTALSAHTGTIDIGHRAKASHDNADDMVALDVDSIVDAESLNSGDWTDSAAGNFKTATLATTLDKKIQKTGGKPVVPAGSTIVITPAGATQTGEVYVQIDYFRIEPGI